MPPRFTKGPRTPFYIDNAPVIFKWFSGKETPMNRAGDRNFGVVLTKEMADQLSEAGYNVKVRKAMDATDEYEARAESYYIKCKLNFNSNKPPRVVLVTCVDGVCKRTAMNEENILLLDSADIEKVDVKIEPYDREESNTRTAYVQNLYVWVNLDKYDAQYDDIPWSDSGAAALGEGPAPEDD